MIGAIIARKSVRSAMKAMNQRDISGLMKNWADDAVWSYPGKLSVSGRFEGKEAVRKWFDNLMRQFPKVKFTIHSVSVSNIFDFIGNNTVATHWDVDFTNRDGHQLEYSGVTILTIKNGKVTHGYDYLYALDDHVSRGWGE